MNISSLSSTSGAYQTTDTQSPRNQRMQAFKALSSLCRRAIWLGRNQPSLRCSRKTVTNLRSSRKPTRSARTLRRFPARCRAMTCLERRKHSSHCNRICRRPAEPRPSPPSLIQRSKQHVGVRKLFFHCRNQSQSVSMIIWRRGFESVLT
jgi:hypothetical protein